MVEIFTKEQDTELSEVMVDKTNEVDELFEQHLRANLQKLVKDPKPKTIENILQYSRSLRK